MAYKFANKELAKLAARARGTGKPKRKAATKRRRRKATVKRAAPRRRRKATVKRAAPRRRVAHKKTKAEIHAMRVRQGKRLAALRKRQLKGGRKTTKRKAKQ